MGCAYLTCIQYIILYPEEDGTKHTEAKVKKSLETAVSTEARDHVVMQIVLENLFECEEMLGLDVQHPK